MIQVQVYLAFFPFIRPAYRHLQPVGRVRYRGHHVDIPATSVDDAFRTRLRTVIAEIGGPQAPAHVPSPRECGWCDIGPNDCPFRVNLPTNAVIANHGLF